jgi:hypothetical protein
MEPHPLFKAFIGASYEHRRRRLAPLVQEAEPSAQEEQAVLQEEPQYSRAD